MIHSPWLSVVSLKRTICLIKITSSSFHRRKNWNWRRNLWSQRNWYLSSPFSTREVKIGFKTYFVPNWNSQLVILTSFWNLNLTHSFKLNELKLWVVLLTIARGSLIGRTSPHPIDAPNWNWYSLKTRYDFQILKKDVQDSGDPI